MQLLSFIEHLALLILVVILGYLLWLRYQEWQAQSKKKKSYYSGQCKLTKNAI